LRGDRLANGQEPPAPQAISPTTFQTAVENLGKLDYATRTHASQTVRHTPAPRAVPGLIEAVRTHNDGYVKYRALVLLTSPRTDVVMRDAMTNINDRLRMVAC